MQWINHEWDRFSHILKWIHRVGRWHILYMHNRRWLDIAHSLSECKSLDTFEYSVLPHWIQEQYHYIRDRHVQHCSSQRRVKRSSCRSRSIWLTVLFVSLIVTELDELLSSPVWSDKHAFACGLASVSVVSHLLSFLSPACSHPCRTNNNRKTAPRTSPRSTRVFYRWRKPIELPSLNRNLLPMT